MQAVGYLRVSTSRQKVIGMSLPAQQAAITGDLERREWPLAGWLEEARSTKRARPELEAAMRWAREHQGAVVIARMDRAFRSNLEFQQAIARARAEGWALVILDPAVDLTSPYGKAMADVAVAFAELERALISQRTREAIEARRVAGNYRGGRMLPQCQPTSG
ncbi:MAG: recombinase family protein, partial [Thermoleophilaceae bacterium]